MVSDLLWGERDIIRRRILGRRAVYLSFIAAWLSFLVYLPAFLVQADAGNPYSWMPRPLPGDLISILTQSGGY